ncbi:hypothetical protein [Zavarzinella formosa]|uniref:hypothetical protein n=1 Tax=Zavarzinella formosa TaxID=360055 RepID=UPI000315CF9F|nr:hypothetical protein [Zavarzinella formosa]
MEKTTAVRTATFPAEDAAGQIHWIEVWRWLRTDRRQWPRTQLRIGPDVVRRLGKGVYESGGIRLTSGAAGAM